MSLPPIHSLYPKINFMSVTALAIKRPILFIIFFLVLGGAGIFAYKQLNYELLPDLAAPFVTVATLYPGASPAEVENSVTKKIEEAVAGVSKLKKATASSSENLSVVSIEFLPDANADQAAQDVQRAISKIQAELPAGAKAPSIEKFNVNDLPVLRLGVTAQMEEPALYALIKNQIKPQLAQIKQTGRVSILGGAEKELRLYLNESSLRSYGVSSLEVVEAIKKSNNDVPVGTIKDTDASLGIRITGKFTGGEELENLPVRTLADGSTIRVKDIARVVWGAREPEVINRVNGQSSIGLFISKQAGANAVLLSQRVRAALAAIEAQYKSVGLRFTVAQDSSEFTLQAANAVYKDFFIAVSLVALVMLVFLHSLRNAAIVLVAIPTSLFSAFILMYLLDYSLNLMTLLAMSLVIGILVDDSIVVLENIYKHLERGKDRVVAALDGRNEIGFAALSITLVDVVVFLPLAFVPGLVGSLVKQFALVIVVSTLSSLIVSFTLTPMIASRFAKLEKLNPKHFFGRIGLFFERGISGFTTQYLVALQWSLRHKAATLGITLLLLFGSFMLVGAGFVGTEFAPATDKGELSLLISLQPGSRLDSTDATFRQIEAKLATLPVIKQTFTTIGYMNDGFTDSYLSHVGAINIALVPAGAREGSLADIGRQVRNLAMEVPGVKARVSAVGLFGANDAPIQLLVYGTRRDSVLNTAERIIERIRGITGLSNPRLSTELGKPEMDIVIDREKAAVLGVDPAQAGMALRTAINGDDELKIRGAAEETGLRILLREGDRNQTGQLSNISVLNRNGQPVYLRQFATIGLKKGPTSLERVNKQASVLILAQATGRPSGDIGEAIRTKMADMTMPDGVALSYEGDLALQDDSFGKLGLALACSFLLIYSIMVALYNNWVYPFVVLFSIPVALVGALLALALTAKSLSIFSIFGLIMMMGLVAKNAILLVDRANDARLEGKPLWDALIDAGATRLRPILMTTLAMVIGMLPLALAKGAGAELNSGLAWVLIGGLSSSMFLTLLVVPVIYYGITHLIERIKRRRQQKYTPSPATTTLLSLILVLLLPVGTKAQVVSLSLDQAIAAGLTNSRTLQIAALEEYKAQWAIKEAKGNLLPVVNATGNYTRNIKVPVAFFPAFGFDPAQGITFDDKNLQPLAAGAYNNYQAALNLSMPLWSAEARAGIQVARANEALLKANTLMSKAQLRDEVRRAYYTVLVAKIGLGITEQIIARNQLHLQTAKSLFRQGLATDADTLSAAVNLRAVLVNRLKTVNAIQTSDNYLKYIVGIPPDQAITLTDTFSLATILPLPDTTSNVVIQRPEILVSRAQQELARQNLLLEKSRYLPVIALASQYLLQAQSNNFNVAKTVWPNSWFVGIQVTIPIFNGGKTAGRIRQNELSLKATGLQEVQLREQTRLEMTNARLNLTETRAAWVAALDLLQPAERSLQLITSRWQKGVAKYNEVADAELTLGQAKHTALQAMYQYYMAYAAWLRATERY
jgi:hydrophobe/amphiphile efflux-1 (HAE1) family protein